eukprot:gene4303-4351_t
MLRQASRLAVAPGGTTQRAGDALPDEVVAAEYAGFEQAVARAEPGHADGVGDAELGWVSRGGLVRGGDAGGDAQVDEFDGFGFGHVAVGGQVLAVEGLGDGGGGCVIGGDGRRGS